MPHRCKLAFVALCLTLAFLGMLPTARADQPVFERLNVVLGTSGGAGAYVSADGNTIVASVPEHAVGTEIIKAVPVMWTPCSGITQFTSAFTGSAFATGVSGDGKFIVGEFEDTDGPKAFRMTPSGSVEFFGIPVRHDQTEATAVSADGSVIAISANGAIYRWTAEGGFEPVEIDGEQVGGWSADMSDDGSTIVGTIEDVGPFRWKTDGTVDQFVPGGKAVAVSGDGAVVVGTTKPSPGVNQRAFRWTEAGGVDVIDHGGDYSDSRPTAVNGDGSVIVGVGGDGAYHAFIWDQVRGMRSLSDVINELGLSDDVADWSYLEPANISADGNVIVGVGRNPHLKFEAWRIVIDPSKLGDEPDTDGDGVCDLADACDGNDASGDTDSDGICDDIDPVDNRPVPGDSASNCPPDITVTATSSDGAVVNFDIPAVGDGSQSKSMYADRTSGSMFPIGSTDVTLFVVDSAHPESDAVVCTFTVTVKAPDASSQSDSGGAVDASTPPGADALFPNGCFAFGAESLMLVPFAGLYLIRRRRRRRSAN